MLSLSLIDTIYYTADRNVTPASVQGVGGDFDFDMDFTSPQRFKRVANRTARFRCVLVVETVMLFERIW
jgi:hypothetical protein